MVLVLGEHEDMSAEARNRASLDLPGVQLDLAKVVYCAARAAGKPIVVVLMNGRPLAVPWLAENVPAILEAWYLGVQTGPALADVLFGDYNPAGSSRSRSRARSGRCPSTTTTRTPAARLSSDERYTSKYIDVPWTPLCPFGHGLSYTTFAYGRPR